MNRKIYKVLAGILCMAVTASAQVPIGNKAAAQRTRLEQQEPQSGFRQNKGQLRDQKGRINSSVKYLLSMKGLNVQLRATGFSYDAWMSKDSDLKFHRVDIMLEGANPDARLVAEHPDAEVTNVFNEYGSFTDIHSYHKVIYKDVYPGIDLEFVARQGKDKPVEYNFIIHPGADASQIRMKYNSGSEICLKDNKVEMHLAFGTLKENIPTSYTEQDGQSLAVQYKTLDETANLYAFNVPDYDKNKTLVIDPTPSLAWATYYGGVGNDAFVANSVDADAAGNVYVAGATTSVTDIATTGAFQSTYGGVIDGFVIKFSPTGQRLWSTYIGGNQTDRATTITTDGTSVYVGGFTHSPSGIAYNGQQNTIYPSGTQDAFLIKFNTTDGSRIWGTYYGGGGVEAFNSLDIAPDGSIVAAGTTGTTSIGAANVATPGSYQVTGGAFSSSMVVKFSSSGVRQWGSFYRSTSGATTVNIQKVDVDASGNIYIAGLCTNTIGLSTPGSFQPAQGGGTDMFIAKMSADGSSRLWGTYLGGSSAETFGDMKVDLAGNLLIFGSMTNLGLGTAGTYQPNASIATGLLSKFAPDGTRLWSTYYAGASSRGALDVDENNNIILASTSSSTNLADNCAFQPTLNGSVDMIISKFTASGSARLWATYWGTATLEGIAGLKYLSNGNFVIGGSSFSTGMATAGAFRVVPDGTDGIIGRFSEQAIVPSDLATSASSLNPASQTACILGIPNIIIGNTITYTTASSFNSPVYYQWQTANAATGPWTDIAGETFKDLQPPPAAANRYYRRLVQVNGSFCNRIAVDSSSASTVLINSNAAPIANADGLQWYVCNVPNNTVTLNGSATGGAGSYTYQWFAGASTTPSATTAIFTPATTQSTTYTLRVTDAVGCVDVDQATVIPAIANAGSDKSICQGSSGVQIGTTPIATPNVVYSWTLANGSPATTLSCTNCALPIANPVTATSYVLTVTVTRKDNSTCSSTDTVTVTPVAAPNGGNLQFAGSDTTICLGATPTLGGTNDAAFTYIWAPGQFLSNANIYNPVYSQGSSAVNCSKTYVVTAISNGCSFTDDVTVTVVNSGITFQGENKCGPLWINHFGAGNCTNATYSWSVVSGTGTILQTSFLGSSAYLNSPTGTTTFRRTTTVNGVSCTADVLVTNCSGGSVCDFDILTTSSQGCPKVFGSGGSFTLATTLPAADYNFSWSPANLVSNPTASSVTITSTANTSITCTVTNKYDSTITCTKTVEINNPAWSIPSFTIPDKNICGSSATAIGIAPVGGVLFTWSPGTGLDDDSTSNPLATLTTNRTYYVTGIQTASGCKSRDTMVVNVANVIADAGLDRAICNGATVVLGNTPPVGTSYTYSWQPTGAAYQNGTGPTDPQPQVLFASASQTFGLIVTDPVSGCTATDSVTLSGTVTTGSYAGSGVTACPGQSVQLGQTAQSLASYQWTMANGSPATGLSCTTCAAPTLTAPELTSTYKVQISYPGCSLPLEDTITVTVLTAPAIALIDQSYCPSSPINIGFGSAGNPVAPANVASYLWSPATGLSSATASNPATTIAVPTNYVVRVTYTNGCIRSDSVQITPAVIANAGNDKTVCPGASTSVGTPAVAGATYAWSGGPFIGLSTIAQPTAIPASTTTYVVSATANGCTATDSVLVNVSTPPDFIITGNTTICQGGSADLGLSAPATPGSGWQWTPIAGVTNPTNPITTIAATDTQTYRLTQTVFSTGCSNYQDVVVVVTPNTITASALDTSICSGNTIALPLTVTSAGSYQYVWSPSTGLSDPYIANPTVTATLDQTYTVTITDNTSQCQNVQSVAVTIKPEIECYPPVSLSGNIFHDANGLKDLTVNSTAVSPIPSGLYVTLVDSAHSAVSTIAVASNGAFNFGITPIGQYSIVLHQTPAGSVTPVLPANWLFMGENLGTGIGSDDALNGILTGISVLGTNVTNANLGIQQPPVSDPKTYSIDVPTTNQSILLNGTHVSTGPGTSSPNQMTGTDAEDGALNGTGNNKTLVITAAPNYGQLWYNGTIVTAGDKIINYNPSLLSITITDTTNSTVSFQYAYTDQAGVESAPVLYTINWGVPLPITLVDFKATKVGSAALLQWETAQEEHTNSFIIERSADSRSWKSIGQVVAAGNSNAILKYELSDEIPLQGSNYYRLKIVFLDGGHETSMIRRLEFSEQTGKIMVVPNPAHKSATLMLDKTYKAPIQVKVSNILGQTIHTYTIPVGANKCPIDLDGMAQGMYTISIDRFESIKLVVE